MTFALDVGTGLDNDRYMKKQEESKHIPVCINTSNSRRLTFMLLKEIILKQYDHLDDIFT